MSPTRSAEGRLANSLISSLAAIALAAAGCGQADPQQKEMASEQEALASISQHRHVRACAAAAAPGFARCHAWIRVNDVTGQLEPLAAAPAPNSLKPADLIDAYKLPSTGGSGMTIAIVDAQDDPNAESDLAVYRAQFGLPPCTTANGCFRKVNQNGQASPLPAPDVGWAEEISLDLDMASAICPSCKILLVEASSASIANLGAAVNRAAAMGANVISNSYGGGESSSDPTTTNQFYNHPGILITASSGDSGFGVEYPAAATTVLAVGGTSLTRASNSRGWTEAAWSGAGSGCSRFGAKPGWQLDTGCARRTVADVSAIADPNTGVAVYDTYGGVGGWLVFGGTSVAAPVVASIFALTGHASATPQYPYSNTTQFFDVVGGSNGTCSPSYLCTAVAGYDGPTGLGTPNGAAMTGGGPPPPNDFSISASPSSLSIVAGNSATSTVSTATTSGSAQTVSLSVSGAPSGVTATLSPTSVTSGGSSTLTVSTTTAAAAGTFTLTVTGTAASGSHSTAVSVTVTTGGGGGCTTSTQLFANPGFESGNTGWTATPAVIDHSNSGSAPRTGTWKAWLDGYGRTHTDDLYQTVSIPAGACSATLSFWLKITSSETTTTTAFDVLTVTVRNSAGTVLSTLATFSNLNKGTSYVQRTFNLSSFAGQSVRIQFHGTEDSSLQTSFFIDDTSLTVVQ
jgi:hypothetical protein